MRHPDGLEGYAPVPDPDPAEDGTEPDAPPADPQPPYGTAWGRYGRWLGWGR